MMLAKVGGDGKVTNDTEKAEAEEKEEEVDENEVEEEKVAEEEAVDENLADEGDIGVEVIVSEVFCISGNIDERDDDDDEM